MCGLYDYYSALQLGEKVFTFMFNAFIFLKNFDDMIEMLSLESLFLSKGL